MLAVLLAGAGYFAVHAFQVRRTAGSLVQVGRGKLSLAAFRGVLRRAEPATAGPVAPARGLYLVRVAYPGLDLSPEMR